MATKCTVEASVRVESARYGDIVQTDFLDSYRNLTLKAVSWMRWVHAHCPQIEVTAALIRCFKFCINIDIYMIQ